MVLLFTVLAGKEEVSLLEADFEFEHGSVKAKIGNAEAHWNASAGLYRYNKDGSKFFSPEVSAEVGASATAFKVEADGSYSIADGFDIQGKGELNIGKVEGKAGVKAVLLDEYGNFKPDITASASAEALLVEAKGSAGVTIAGIEANVKGKVGVGVGAKAEVGYVDGKFSFEVGAYLGVGASIGFEVDVGAAVNAVCDGAEAAWNWLTG